MSVDVRDLSHRYGDRPALENVSFEVGAGEVFGVLGPNGGGKSTLFRILSTALRPTSGAARVAGTDVADPAARAKIGVVFQAPAVDKRLTVRENLLHHGHLYGLRGSLLASRIGEELARFGLSDRAGDLVETLSGGLQRRVELAKALLHRPAVLLLDEPSTGLDPGARREFWDALRTLQGTTILLTTHLMDEAELCGRLVLLHRGKVAASGRPLDLRGEIGGEVLRVRSPRPDELAREIRGRFGVEPERVDGELRLSRERAHALAAEIAEAFPALVDSLTVSKPSLEDVFLAKTRERWT
jgi:ABC-2 type transport system ATP-binding protein